MQNGFQQSGLEFSALPGGELIEKGLRDFADGATTVESLLVQAGAPRLQPLGIEIPRATGPELPEHRLYRLLAAEHGDAAHSRYNALMRRLVSFARAAECVRP